MKLLKCLSLVCLTAGLLLGCAPAATNNGAANSASPRPEATPPKNLILSEYTAGGLKDYLSDIGSIGHGYFAVAVDGADYAWWLCDQISCTQSRAWQRSRALEDCRKASGGLDCVILAENRDIVLAYQTYPIPLPPLAAADVPPQVAATTRPPAPPSDQRAKKGRPGWNVDQTHGCWIWNRDPQGEDEVVTWTGACAADGKAVGDGVLEWKEESRYIGPMAEGRKEGRGRTVNAWGDSYQGGFSNDLRNGQGAYTWGDGAHYEGNYKDGYPDGFGTFTERGEVYRGDWKTGCFNDGTRKKKILDIDIPGCS